MVGFSLHEELSFIYALWLVQPCGEIAIFTPSTPVYALVTK
ncbi:hypothetical protein OPT79_63 [Klebsiella phage vB_KpnD_Opt-79]|nr:hypothetical protein OPT79_63 [Klebsiella phage vB_KpnD_Opt-79]